MSQALFSAAFPSSGRYLQSVGSEKVLGNGSPLATKAPTITIEPIGPGTNPENPDIKPSVNNLILGASGSITARVNEAYTLSLSATDPGADSIRNWTIDWGDGTVEQIDGNPNQAEHI